MKKIIALGVLSCLAFVGVAMGASEGTITMSATPSSTLSITVTPVDPVNFGSYSGYDASGISTASVGGTKTITADGNVDVTAKIKSSDATATGGSWALVAGAGGGNNTFSLRYSFAGGALANINPANSLFKMGTITQGTSKSLDMTFYMPSVSSVLDVPFSWTATIVATAI